MGSVNRDYDVIIVGAGMIGSAAAKYICTENRKLRVALIGPSEPKNKEDATIHGTHYDEGRICRSVDADMIWGALAKRSCARFRDIERQSGLKIYEDVGYLNVGPRGWSPGRRIQNNAGISGEVYQVLDDIKELPTKFPYMAFGMGVQGIYMPKNSGYLNPRKLVQAQKYIAEQAGCDYIDDVVDSVALSPSGDYVMQLAQNIVVTSRKVLLATGGFTHSRDLLPKGLQPDMTQHPNTVILVEMDKEDQNALRGMPCMGYKGGPWDSPDLNFLAYIMPPIKYPDGKYYLKVGHGKIRRRLLETREEIARWYQQGNDPVITEFLIDLTRTIFPHIKMDRYKFDYCVTTGTPKGYPYIDLIRPGLGVAIGGCGQGAKGSDEMGKMAASMIIKGRWDHDLPEGAFKFKAFKVKNQTPATSKL